MSKVKVGSKVRINRGFYSPRAPFGEYEEDQIVTVARVVSNGAVVFEGERPHGGWNVNGCREYFEVLNGEKTMTPCERLGYKVGDAFVAPFNNGKVKKGDIIYLFKDDGGSCPYFSLSASAKKSDACFYIFNVDKTVVAKPHKPKTEAERRGAKFGVGGVVKETGEKVIFHSEKNNMWWVFKEEYDHILGFRLNQIRLDHEPEYKEIPFEEATHEQRMCVENLVYSSGRKVVEILRFQNGDYVYWVEGINWPLSFESRLTVKIPA